MEIQINSAFYAKALEAYELFINVFICNTSDLFCSAWKNEEAREMIYQHAQMFLGAEKQGQNIYLDSDELILFVNLADISSRDLRIEFFKWAIQNIKT